MSERPAEDMKLRQTSADNYSGFEKFLSQTTETPILLDRDLRLGDFPVSSMMSLRGFQLHELADLDLRFHCFHFGHSYCREEDEEAIKF
jgi:hypothetical protein